MLTSSLGVDERTAGVTFDRWGGQGHGGSCKCAIVTVQPVLRIASAPD